MAHGSASVESWGVMDVPEWCAAHNRKWQQAYPRQPGPSNTEYIGHVLLHQTAEGAVFTYWHSMDFRQEWADVLRMQAKAEGEGE